MKKYKLSLDQLPFDLDQTLSCGQVFRWEKISGTWTGVVQEKVVTVLLKEDTLYYQGFTEAQLINYFNLNFNIREVLHNIREKIHQNSGMRNDPVFERVVAANLGLRIIKQDPFECVISYICSQNSNIPGIKKRINNLSSRYGKLIENNVFSFPKPQNLSCSVIDDILACKTGYRARYIVNTSNFIQNNPDFLKNISTLSMQQARQELLTLSGVGPKVADCILLFAYNYYEAVPVDVWVRTIMIRYYPDLSNRKGARKECSYDTIADFCRDYFGQYAGYAQQIFFAARHMIT